MEENYLIEITNKQQIDDQVEEISLTTKGSYLEKNGKRYIVYREFDQEGKKGQTSTLKIDNTGENKIVSLIRHGANNTKTNLILEQGKRHLCQYGTPYGSITLGVFTSCIKDTLQDHGGTIEVEYTLDVNTNLSSVNAIKIQVKESGASDGIA